jgi:hypothetical protein
MASSPDSATAINTTMASGASSAKIAATRRPNGTRAAGPPAVVGLACTSSPSSQTPARRVTPLIRYRALPVI